MVDTGWRSSLARLPSQAPDFCAYYSSSDLMKDGFLEVKDGVGSVNSPSG